MHFVDDSVISFHHLECELVPNRFTKLTLVSYIAITETKLPFIKFCKLEMEMLIININYCGVFFVSTILEIRVVD